MRMFALREEWITISSFGAKRHTNWKDEQAQSGKIEVKKLRGHCYGRKASHIASALTPPWLCSIHLRGISLPGNLRKRTPRHPSFPGATWLGQKPRRDLNYEFHTMTLSHNASDISHFMFCFPGVKSRISCTCTS